MAACPNLYHHHRHHHHRHAMPCHARAHVVNMLTPRHKHAPSSRVRRVVRLSLLRWWSVCMRGDTQCHCRGAGTRQGRVCEETRPQSLPTLRDDDDGDGDGDGMSNRLTLNTTQRYTII